jgi:hypothetical protein
MRQGSQEKPKRAVVAVYGRQSTDETCDMSGSILRGGATMSDYGNNRRLFLAWKMEERKRRLRYAYYHTVDALGFIGLCMIGIIATACVIFCVAYR